MNVQINISNQKLKVASNVKTFVSGSQEFVKFTFNLPSDLSALKIAAQFTQNGVSYNKFLDSENSVYLPSELKEGDFSLTIEGTNGNVIGTFDRLEFHMIKKTFSDDSESTIITQSLYQQLVTEFNKIKDAPVSQEKLEEYVNNAVSKFLQDNPISGSGGNIVMSEDSDEIIFRIVS